MLKWHNRNVQSYEERRRSMREFPFIMYRHRHQRRQITQETKLIKVPSPLYASGAHELREEIMWLLHFRTLISTHLESWKYLQRERWAFWLLKNQKYIKPKTDLKCLKVRGSCIRKHRKHFISFWRYKKKYDLATEDHGQSKWIMIWM